MALGLQLSLQDSLTGTGLELDWIGLNWAELELAIRSMDAVVQWGFSLGLYLLPKGGYSLTTEYKQGNIMSRQGGLPAGRTQETYYFSWLNSVWHFIGDLLTSLKY